MSSPLKKAQSLASEAKSAKGKEKSPTPGPASPTGAKSPTPGPASLVPRQPSEPTNLSLLSGAHWGEQEVDDDNDSILGSDAESSTASISSSIMQYRNVLGRTYHSDLVTDGEYWGPNDDKANEMLDIIHATMVMLFDGKLYTSPLNDNEIKNVIDIGTGTGVWAIDFADDHPNCTVIGTDISPIQPSWVPPNARFEIDDATKEWTYPENHFDFIHLRFMTGVIKDWDALYKEAYRCAKPGAWIEHLDGDADWICLDGTMPHDSALAQWGPIWKEVGRKTGLEFCVASSDKMEKGMKNAGFTNVTSEDYYVPISPWSDDPKMKQLGLYQSAALTHDLEGFMVYFLPNYLGWTPKEIANYAAICRKEFREGKIHSNIRWRVVRAQKPFDA
ncbi:S-adenosyl-L-methionine-dependent methyltransferase [Pseudoneurospora amorphoporcata]|uniref:S-adenosyl-L-methionine-dependent methyltransferase n=1 Tax=Pseudoneurospora amorphoporcata TaxID=241081 RepID=A0AAN6NJK8_9PEZI|nr:S-adenosyl-L-methionine-dependent methyltransferase [Pseudoneurospora amorphoporcata]